MEPSFEQESAEKQHQTTCAAVSENAAISLLELSVQHQKVFYTQAKNIAVFFLLCDVLELILCTRNPELNQTVTLRSGMLEQGVDRIVAQVVDPKINHIFRPQVERVVREFLSPGSCSEEPPAPLPSTETKPDSSIPEQGTHIVSLYQP